MLRWSVCLVAGVVAAALALPADAQWKWRDANGRTQYSDLPPPAGIAERDILSRPAAAARAVQAPSTSAAASAAPPAKGAEPELEAKRKLAEQAEADRRKAEDAKIAAARAENCQRAREQIRTLDSGMRLAKLNAAGEREMVDDAGRADQARRAREVIASDCR